MSWGTAGELLPNLLERLGLNPQTAAVFTFWDKEIGNLGKGIDIVGWRQGVIYVRVKQALFFHELCLQKKEFLHRLNQHFGGKNIIRDVRRIMG